jgi:hypothetical protein
MSPPMIAVSPSRRRTMVEACFTSVTGAVCRPSGLVTMAWNRVMAGSTSSVIVLSPSICGVTARIVPIVIVETEKILLRLIWNAVVAPGCWSVVVCCSLKNGRSSPTLINAV